MPRILPAALLTLLALILLPAQAHAAKGMEMALQDDAVFLWEARDGPRLRARPRRRPAHEAHPRQRAVGARAGRRGREPHGPVRRAEVRLPPDRHPRGRRGQARHQAPADDRGPGPGLGHARPPGRQQRPRRRQVRRVRARPSPRTSPGAWTATRSGTSPTGTPGCTRPRTPRALPPALQQQLQRDQGRRPAGQGPVRRARPDRRRPRDRAAEVPARRHLLQRALQGREALRAAEGRRLRDPPVPVPARPPRWRPTRPTTCRSARSRA